MNEIYNIYNNSYIYNNIYEIIINNDKKRENELKVLLTNSDINYDIYFSDYNFFCKNLICLLLESTISVDIIKFIIKKNINLDNQSCMIYNLSHEKSIEYSSPLLNIYNNFNIKHIYKIELLKLIINRCNINLVVGYNTIDNIIYNSIANDYIIPNDKEKTLLTEILLKILEYGIFNKNNYELYNVINNDLHICKILLNNGSNLNTIINLSKNTIRILDLIMNEQHICHNIKSKILILFKNYSYENNMLDIYKNHLRSIAMIETMPPTHLLPKGGISFQKNYYY